MTRTTRRADASKYRAVLSDVLPYELPVPFSNLSLYHALRSLKMRSEKGVVTARWVGSQTPYLLTVLFGCYVPFERIPGEGLITFQDPGDANGKRVFPETRSMPLRTQKSTGSDRWVSLLHPRAQVSVSEFYESYESSILYFTSRSRYSIRRPVGVARYTVHRDALFENDLADPSHTVEDTEHESDELRSYFIYERYPHIYRFYESSEMLSLERRFEFLARFDVTRCFESIYTHSISWVTNGKYVSKEFRRQSDRTFGGKFDKLMQSLNEDETHGIVIGPEVSRVFAEIILQEIDVRCERALARQGIRFGRDYIVRRYLDDFFVFASDMRVVDSVKAELADSLREFRLFLNEDKSRVESLPGDAGVSIAKDRVAEVVRDWLEVEQHFEMDEPLVVPSGISVRGAILDYKAALHSSGADHALVANFALSRLEINLDRYLRGAIQHHRHDETRPWSHSEWGRLARLLAGVIEVAAGVYVGAEAASPAVKLCRISVSVERFARAVSMPAAYASNLRLKVARTLRTMILRESGSAVLASHTLMLLDCLTSLGGEYSLADAELRLLLPDLRRGPFDAVSTLCILRHCSGVPGLGPLRREVEAHALESLRLGERVADAHSSMLSAALLSSPLVSKESREGILDKLGFPVGERNKVDGSSRLLFEWDLPDYYGALQRKRGNSVY